MSTVDNLNIWINTMMIVSVASFGLTALLRHYRRAGWNFFWHLAITLLVIGWSLKLGSWFFIPETRPWM